MYVNIRLIGQSYFKKEFLIIVISIIETDKEIGFENNCNKDYIF